MKISNGLRRRTVYFVACLCALVLILFVPLRQLVLLALSSDSHSHILFIPFITIALLWMNRGQIFETVDGTSKVALPLAVVGAIMAGSALYLRASSDLTDFLELSVFGFLCLVWAAFLLFYGSRTFRLGLFPLLFLILMIPIPDAVLESVIEWLQVRSADLTYWIFWLTGTPVIRHGVVLAVPGVTIRVAEECSSIRSSTALFIVCMVAGYLLLRTPWARLIFLAFVLPVSILKNGIRIATLTLLAVHVDPSFLAGSLHRDGGFIFFGIGLVMMLPILWWLQRIEAPAPQRALTQPAES